MLMLMFKPTAVPTMFDMYFLFVCR